MSDRHAAELRRFGEVRVAKKLHRQVHASDIALHEMKVRYFFNL